MSARTAEALQQSRSALAAELSGADEVSLPDVAYTLARRRKENIRMAAVVNDQQHAAAVLETAETRQRVRRRIRCGATTIRSESSSCSPVRAPSTSGWRAASTTPSRCSPSTSTSAPQGSATSWVSTCARRSSTGTARNLERTDRTQPALFTVEYALAKLIESYGVRPAALAGHSIGEYVAGTIAGVFDIETAIKVVSMRARLMHAAPRGVMVAVALSPDAIAEYLTATSTSPRQRSGRLRRRRVRGEHSPIQRTPHRRGHRGPPGPHLARLPLAVDGSR